MGRRIDSRGERVKIDHQNVVLIIATVIVARLSGHNTGFPGIQVSPSATNTQLSLSPHPDDNLVVFVPMLVSGDGKLEKFCVEH